MNCCRPRGCRLEECRREITIFFADVRGFTTLTDSSQERVAEYVREKKLSHSEAEALLTTRPAKPSVRSTCILA
jgi:class 3 adenylate cyclase